MPTGSTDKRTMQPDASRQCEPSTLIPPSRQVHSRARGLASMRTRCLPFGVLHQYALQTCACVQGGTVRWRTLRRSPESAPALSTASVRSSVHSLLAQRAGRPTCCALAAVTVSASCLDKRVASEWPGRGFGDS